MYLIKIQVICHLKNKNVKDIISSARVSVALDKLKKEKSAFPSLKT